MLMISTAYLNYMWDVQRRFKSNLIVEMLDRVPTMTQLSEQTLYTIAHDIAQVREYAQDEVICNQDTDS